MKKIYEKLLNEPVVVFAALSAAFSASAVAFDWLMGAGIATVITAVGAAFTRNAVTPTRTLQTNDAEAAPDVQVG